ncbi:uncharacterized protein [Spinacia oleracea]|uniref:Uncharacterized protein n=1 Tax=Spinacia oleracea TaxID=3562 RepID=A0ABM3QVH7_SPIOL|nr:uncharacterized protein LOC110798376 [Spinacia oleracea]XP_056687378.1 uncharacterized protein LOC110798376 [Spinacia oleracea]XP_056687379.1 uncharacterized protein LOC110798376 [Spinacia oleracea]
MTNRNASSAREDDMSDLKDLSVFEMPGNRVDTYQMSMLIGNTCSKLPNNSVSRIVMPLNFSVSLNSSTFPHPNELSAPTSPCEPPGPPQILYCRHGERSLQWLRGVVGMLV